MTLFPLREPPDPPQNRPATLQQLAFMYSSSESDEDGSDGEGSQKGRSHSSTASLSNSMRSVSMRERALRTAADRSRQHQNHPLIQQLQRSGSESEGKQEHEFVSLSFFRPLYFYIFTGSIAFVLVYFLSFFVHLFSHSF